MIAPAMWGSKPVAIPRGVFAEDQGEINDVVLKIYRSLEPRDSLEAAQAMHIGQQYVRLTRLNRFEAEALVADTKNHTPFVRTDEDLRASGARRTLEQSFNNVSAIDGRISRSLERAFTVYADMKRRSLPDED